MAVEAKKDRTFQAQDQGKNKHMELEIAKEILG